MSWPKMNVAGPLREYIDKPTPSSLRTLNSQKLKLRFLHSISK